MSFFEKSYEVKESYSHMKLKCLLTFFSFLFFSAVHSQKRLQGTPAIPPEITQETERFSAQMRTAYSKGDFELHKAYSDSLYVLSKEYHLKEMRVKALNNQAIYFKNRSQRQKAIALYHEALEVCGSIVNDQRPEAMTLVNLGNMYTAIGAYQKSVNIMDRLLKLTDTVKQYSRIRVAALSGQATNFQNLNDYVRATEFQKQAIQTAQMMKDSTLIAVSYNNLADVHLNQKAYAEALAITNKGLRYVTKETPGQTVGLLLLNKGVAQYELGRTLEAKSNFLKALEIARTNNDLLALEMYIQDNLARVYEKEKAYEKSYEAQKEYLRLREIIKADEKKTAITDLEREIAVKQGSLENVKQEAGALKKNTYILKWGAAIVILLITIVLLYFIGKKKTVTLQHQDLKKEYEALRLHIEQPERPTEKKIKEDNQVPYQNSSLTPEDRASFKQQILEIMETKKPFLKPDLRLPDLAKEVGLSTAHLSEVLHYGFQDNFYNFINVYRVLEAQKLLDNAAYKDKKIIAVAFDAGFSSKTTFNRVFKNYTGHTPTAYRKNVSG